MKKLSKVPFNILFLESFHFEPVAIEGIQRERILERFRFWIRITKCTKYKSPNFINFFNFSVFDEIVEFGETFTVGECTIFL